MLENKIKQVSPVMPSSLTQRLQFNKIDRRWIYPTLVILIYIVWASYMTLSDNWVLFQEFWPVSVTMALGSVIAGATPQGGATVAFPVFTKVLHIASHDARTFGLMIQAVGMTMAAVFIYVRRIPVLLHVIGWVSVGGAVGVIAGAFIGQMPGPYPKILFTFATTAFGVALVLSRWVLKSSPRNDIAGWGNGHRFVFALTGIFGGFFAANTGAGTDMFAFILLTLAFGVNEKISTPTTVIIMGINSVVGFALYAALPGEIGPAWNYWLVAVPIVILGAPLGALITSRIKRDYLILFILFLTGVELTTTIWLVPFNQTMIRVAIITIIACALSFWGMLSYRNRQ
ncbi:MAG: sulfite exporter TauE/SafE family protein [Chloroflexota bacterium]